MLGIGDEISIFLQALLAGNIVWFIRALEFLEDL